MTDTVVMDTHMDRDTIELEPTEDLLKALRTADADTKTLIQMELEFRMADEPELWGKF